jgi:hypothetical protein
MRCPDCNKFVSLELGEEPEAELEVSEGVVSGSVRLVRNCADCNTELKEATFEVEVEMPAMIAHAEMHAKEREEKESARKLKVEQGEEVVDDEDEEYEQEVEIDECEATEEGGGRYKNGVNVAFTVKCSCGKDGCEETGNFEDKIAASHMDEMT